MSQMTHIMRKDVRRLRGLLALGLAILVARVMLVVNGAVAADDSVATGMLLQQTWGTFGMVELLVMAVIVAQLVLEEPLVGFTPFWLTRPYDAGSLLRAKLLLAAVLLVGLPVIADVVTMSLFNAGPRALVQVGTSSALIYASWMLSLTVLAALTPSLGAFVLATLAIVTAVSMLPATLIGFARLWTAEIPSYTPPRAPDATPGVMLMAVYLCAATSVVVYQYRHRRWRVAAGLAVAGLAATVVVPLLWPWPFARGEQVQPGAWASNVSVVHDPSWETKLSDVRNVSRPMREAWRQVSAHIKVSGIPPQITVRSIGIRSTLQFPDGTAVESSQSGGFGSFAGAAVTTVEAAVGARILSTRDLSEPVERWTPMITIGQQDFVRHRGRSGRLEANLDLIATEMREVATLRLMPGVALDGAVSRLEIVAVQRGTDTDSREVVIRRWRTQSPLSVEREPDRFFALRRRSSGEALMAGVENSWQAGSRPNATGMFLSLPFAMVGRGFFYGREGFSVGTIYLRFPGRGFGKAPPLNPGWFDEAELVVLESASAGVVTRRLVIEEFVVPAN